MFNCSILKYQLGANECSTVQFYMILIEKGKKLDNKEVLITFEKLESKKLVEKLRKNRLNHKSDEA